VKNIKSLCLLAFGILAVAGCGASGAAVDPTGEVTGVQAALRPSRHRPWPTLTSQGGPVMKAPTVVSIVPQNHPFANELMQFGLALGNTSWWWDINDEYQLGYAMWMSAVQGPPLAGAVDTPALYAYVQGGIDRGEVQQPDGNMLYVLYVPPDAQVQDKPCQTYGGYHDTFPTPGGVGGGDTIAFAIGCYQDPQDPNSLDTVTTIASHEIAEALTNPLWAQAPAWRLPGLSNTPWEDSPWRVTPGEAGDLCAFHVEIENGFMYQRIWSVSAAAAGLDPCIPQNGRSFFNVSNAGAPDWTPIQPGQTARIPLTGWRDGKPGAGWWQLTWPWLSQSSSGFSGASPTLEDANWGGPNGCDQQALASNGSTATLTLTAPAGAVSGDWAIIEVDSYRQDDTQHCAAFRGEDWRSFWFVGVYVP
jgi:hypothetical protein